MRQAAEPVTGFEQYRRSVGLGTLGIALPKPLRFRNGQALEERAAVIRSVMLIPPLFRNFAVLQVRRRVRAKNDRASCLLAVHGLK